MPLRFNLDWLWGLILVLAVILIYQPVWWAGYVWDDPTLITANPCIVGPLGLKEIWTTNAADVCPLTLTTFWVEHALWGVAPLPYHLVNVLLHGACAVVLWQVLRSLRVPGAWLGAALWAVHPVEVESVAWISEMKNTESGVFFLLTIFFFVRELRRRDLSGQTGGGWNYGLTLVFAALAMASKSSTVILPVILFLCAWWMEGRWHWRNLWKVGPIFLMSVAAGVVSMWTQQVQGANDPQWVRSWLERLITAGDAVWFYLGKLLWPHPLVLIYPRWEIDAGQGVSYLPLLAVIVVFLILWFKRESWARPFFVVFTYFLVTLLPALGLVNHNYLHYSFVADHFQYLAGMGPLALIGAGLVRWADIAMPGKVWARSSLCAGILAILGALSWQRAWVYENNETLWTDTLAGNPKCWLAYNNLGYDFSQKGRVDEAMIQFQKSLELAPNFDQAHSNLGTTLYQKGRLDEAMAEFQKALLIDPKDAEAHADLGMVLYRKGRMDEAMAQDIRAIEINPLYAKAHGNLGTLLLHEGQVDGAMVQFQQDLEINSSDAEAHYNLGIILSQKGRMNEAIAHYQRAVEINPSYAEAHTNLGNVFSQEGRVDEALAHFQKAVEINPSEAEAHVNLGNVLLLKKRADEAIAQFNKALALDPSLVQAHSNLGIALFQKGRVDEAIAQFQEILRLNPNDARAQAALAKIMAITRQNAPRK